MKIVNFCKEGKSFSDFTLEEDIKSFFESDKEELKVSNAIAVDAARAYCIENDCEFELQYKGEFIYMDKEFECYDFWNKPYTEIDCKFLRTLFKLKKENKND